MFKSYYLNPLNNFCKTLSVYTGQGILSVANNKNNLTVNTFCFSLFKEIIIVNLNEVMFSPLKYKFK